MYALVCVCLCALVWSTERVKRPRPSFFDHWFAFIHECEKQCGNDLKTTKHLTTQYLWMNFLANARSNNRTQQSYGIMLYMVWMWHLYSTESQRKDGIFMNRTGKNTPMKTIIGMQTHFSLRHTHNFDVCVWRLCDFTVCHFWVFCDLHVKIAWNWYLFFRIWWKKKNWNKIVRWPSHQTQHYNWQLLWMLTVCLFVFMCANQDI